jgi:hypothetical protein
MGWHEKEEKARWTLGVEGESAALSNSKDRLREIERIAG